MPAYIEQTEPVTLPVIVLRNTVAFPLNPINFEAVEEEDEAALKAAARGNSFIFLVAERDDDLANEEDFPFYRFGTVAKIKQMIRTPEGQTRVIADCVVRAAVSLYRMAGKFVEADLICKHITLPGLGETQGEALCNEMKRALAASIRYLPAASGDLVSAVQSCKDPGELADFIAANVLIRVSDKQAVLECLDPLQRGELLLQMLASEEEILKTEAMIHQKVNERMSRNQKEYYLREQIKVIQEELGEGSDTEEFAKRIKEANLPSYVEEKLSKENDRLAKIPYGAAESTVLSNYLDTCLDIPWTKESKERLNFDAVQKVLDADHYGLEKVKERIVEYIAAKQCSPALKNQILCLVGPPGVGKTSIAASIARAMNRKYVRLSLGGVRDESDIRGHRKTYIGAMPGRVITALIQVKVRNPLILLDEIDKLTRDSHGDPSSALLEVLDGEQNKAFRDHFVEIPFDLSDCMFIATANSLDSIPKPLIDRMEIIEIGIYTKREKSEIAKKYLLPKQMLRHGLSRRTLKVTDEAVLELIDYYTREAGVRNLERSIATLCRKADKILLSGDKKKIIIDKKDISTYLGARKLLPESVDPEDMQGCVNGLAYTELGGSLLKVEVAVLEGTGKIETTGSLGDVMKESAHLAVSYVRSIAAEYGIPTDFYKTKDIHIHFPEGAVPKDGPSAGVAMTVALVSALSGRRVRHEVAMTGEISLRGNVLAIGGLKEKTMAAYNAGVKAVLIPHDNLPDLEEIDPLARENLKFIPCRRAEEALHHALIAPAVKKAKENDSVAAGKVIPVPANTPAGRVHFNEK